LAGVVSVVVFVVAEVYKAKWEFAFSISGIVSFILESFFFNKIT